MDQITFARENQARIRAVEHSFGPSGRPLFSPDRTLVGEGCLVKQNRKKNESKVFFLFNDILVYGRILVNGRWYNKQRVIPLEHLELEDMEDGAGRTNQWLIRAPRKSFFVSAPSLHEKHEWMDHIRNCRATRLESGTCRPSSEFAMTWIPDCAAQKCMRCWSTFTATNRRHHCRKCGFLVCNTCSQTRELIEHIHPTKKLRVCGLCQAEIYRRHSSGSANVDLDDMSGCSEEEEDVVRRHSWAPKANVTLTDPDIDRYRYIHRASH